MAFTLNFEGGFGIKAEEIVLALKEAGVKIFVEEPFGLSGNFVDSNMHFVLFDRARQYWKESGMQSCVISGDLAEKLEWDIWVRVSFKCIPESYSECSAELHKFLERLAGLTAANFLLSFQYESIYAVRDENGLRFIEDF